MSKKKNIKNKFARMDLPVLKKSIFTTSTDRKGGLKVEFSGYGYTSLTYTCHEKLNHVDLTFFVAAIALICSEVVSVVHNDNENKSAKSLRNGIFEFKENNIEVDIRDKIACTNSTLKELVDYTGYEHGGDTYKRARDSLIRLACTNIIVREDRDEHVQRLLYHHLDPATGKLSLSVNTISTMGIFGDQYKMINMNNFITLNNPVEKTVFIYCCFNFDPEKKAKKRFIDTICDNLYENFHTIQNKSKVRNKVISALKTISNFDDWEIFFDGKGAKQFIHAKRPK